MVSNGLDDDMKQMQKDLAKVNLSVEGVNQQLKRIIGDNTDIPSNVSLVEIMNLLKKVVPKNEGDIDSRRKPISSSSSSSSLDKPPGR